MWNKIDGVTIACAYKHLLEQVSDRLGKGIEYMFVGLGDIGGCQSYHRFCSLDTYYPSLMG